MILASEQFLVLQSSLASPARTSGPAVRRAPFVVQGEHLGPHQMGDSRAIRHFLYRTTQADRAEDEQEAASASPTTLAGRAWGAWSGHFQAPWDFHRHRLFHPPRRLHQQQAWGLSSRGWPHLPRRLRAWPPLEYLWVALNPPRVCRAIHHSARRNRYRVRQAEVEVPQVLDQLGQGPAATVRASQVRLAPLMVTSTATPAVLGAGTAEPLPAGRLGHQPETLDWPGLLVPPSTVVLDQEQRAGPPVRAWAEPSGCHPAPSPSQSMDVPSVQEAQPLVSPLSYQQQPPSYQAPLPVSWVGRLLPDPLRQPVEQGPIRPSRYVGRRSLHLSADCAGFELAGGPS